MRRIPRFWLVLIGATALSIGVVWSRAIPLGVPGEWEWSRAIPNSGIELAFTLAGGAIAAAAYLGLVSLGAQHIVRAGRSVRAAWLLGLWAAGFAWLWVAQESAPEGYQLSRASWVLYFRGTSGYFSEARYTAASTQELLAGYTERMSKGDVLHIGTHPPGLILAYRGLMELVRKAPVLTDLLIATQPANVRESFDVIANHAVRNEPLTRDDRAILWLAALLVMGLCSATVLPVYGCLRFDSSPQSSWMAASFWPVLPGLSVFLPKSDALLPCFGMAFVYFWLSGWHRQSLVRCAIAGALLWCGMLISLALLPVVLLAGLLTLREILFPETYSNTGRFERSTAVRALLSGAAGFLVPCLGLWLASGLSLFRVWAWNYANHAGFYGQFPRTYWKWLLVNPLELVFTAGAPLALIALWSAIRTTRERNWRAASLCGACGLTWLLLLVSGKNMGEAARLWLILTPWLVLCAAPFFDERPSRSSPDSDVSTLWKWRVALACQFAVTIAIATRVVGFTIPGANVPNVTTVTTGQSFETAELQSAAHLTGMDF